MRQEEIREKVRESYAKTARGERSCCGGAGSAQVISKKIGYAEDELEAVPKGANLGLGCGNPVALASLREGETVLDLGSGAGFDSFLAAGRVGKKGRVIGVDMTPEMIEKARKNGLKGHYDNVEFRLGELEELPVAGGSVDVVISNCVINLVPDKERAFSEAFRVLKPGGRVMISDIVLLKELPDSIKSSIEAYIGCLSGAMMKDDYLSAIERAGFREIGVIDQTSFGLDCMLNDPTAKAIIERRNRTSEEIDEIAGSVVSIKVYGVKPTRTER
jgi:SAM-dependent methyltransferase